MTRSSLILVLCLILAVAPMANAGGIIVKPKGNTFGEQTRILSTWYIGWTTRSISVSTNERGCLRVVYYYFAFGVPLPWLTEVYEGC